MPKRIRRARKTVETPVVPTEEISVCANCNKKYEADGVALCPQCRQV